MTNLPVTKQKSPRSAAAAKPTVSVPNLLVDLPGGKNPVSMLYELYSGTQLAIDDDLTSEVPGVFVARVRIEDRDFTVCLQSSQTLEKNCRRSRLRRLH